MSPELRNDPAAERAPETQNVPDILAEARAARDALSKEIAQKAAETLGGRVIESRIEQGKLSVLNVPAGSKVTVDTAASSATAPTETSADVSSGGLVTLELPDGKMYQAIVRPGQSETSFVLLDPRVREYILANRKAAPVAKK